MNEIEINYGGVKLTLCYGERGVLEAVIKEDGSYAVMTYSMSGSGVSLGEPNFLGRRPVQGPMVQIDKTDIYVPYRLFWQGVPE